MTSNTCRKSSVVPIYLHVFFLSVSPAFRPQPTSQLTSLIYEIDRTPRSLFEIPLRNRLFLPGCQILGVSCRRCSVLSSTVVDTDPLTLTYILPLSFECARINVKPFITECLVL